MLGISNVILIKGLYFEPEILRGGDVKLWDSQKSFFRQVILFHWIRWFSPKQTSLKNFLKEIHEKDSRHFKRNMNIPFMYYSQYRSFMYPTSYLLAFSPHTFYLTSKIFVVLNNVLHTNALWSEFAIFVKNYEALFIWNLVKYYSSCQ